MFRVFKQMNVRNRAYVIDSKGNMTRDCFMPPVSHNYYVPYDFSYEDEASSEYRKSMINYAATIGIPRAELEWLQACGFPDVELEECIFDDSYRSLCLMDTGFYDEMEDDVYDDFENLPWM